MAEKNGISFKKVVLFTLLAFVVCQCEDNKRKTVLGEQLQLSAILPKLEAIHEDAKSLLIRNAELKGKILAGLQAQINVKVNEVKKIQLLGNPSTNIAATNVNNNDHHPTIVATPINQQLVKQAEQQITGGMNSVQNSMPVSTTTTTSKSTGDANRLIDYAELDEFNRWVDKNLEYAVKNTQATAETLKEESLQNNGNVDYSEQAIKDGIEGVKYWQQAVIFQDKTLKNEKFETMD